MKEIGKLIELKGHALLIGIAFEIICFVLWIMKGQSDGPDQINRFIQNMEHHIACDTVVFKLEHRYKSVQTFQIRLKYIEVR